MFANIFIILNVLYVVVASLNLCSERNDENLNNYTFVNENYTLENCGCSSNGPCITKCCKPGFYLEHRTCKKHNFPSSSSSPFTITVYDYEENVPENEYYIFPHNFKVAMLKCTFFVLKPYENETDKFYIKNDGVLWYSHLNLYYENDQYCIEYAGDDNKELKACVCERNARDIIAIGMIISMPFLLATLIVYALLPERNLHMKALMFYVFSLLMAYICLVILQLNTKEIPKTECQVIAFFTFFFFMASFFWMNVICIDIWFTFSGLRGFNGSKRSAERKRLLFYCAYAWGLTIALSTSVFLINNFGNSDAWYHPKIGNGRCWFEHDYQQLIYFYGPMAILIFINIVLFCLTAYKIRQSQNETKMLRRDDSKRHAAESDQQKFYLYMKLFLAMGVNWTMEFLSWIIEWKVQADTKYMFYVTDFCNAIYGVFIFFLFVCKMKIWCLLKKRYYSFMGKPYFARETTLRTHSSNFSGTESTMFSDNDHNRDSRPLRLNSMK